MPQTAQSAPAPKSFAGFLAALTEPEKKKPPLSWTEDALEDDIATLSYEHALRAHARYRSADATELSLAQPLDQPLAQAPVQLVFPSMACAQVAAPAAHSAASNATPPAPQSDAVTSTAHGLPSAQNRNLKCASITIRLSPAECAQLRQRAAEAGLTVSAYLRSCTFEVESLRALVKDTMAQLRSANSAGKQATPPAARHSWSKGWRGFLRPGTAASA
jgi:hypothetical protein